MLSLFVFVQDWW